MIKIVYAIDKQGKWALPLIKNTALVTVTQTAKLTAF